jgi:hypothetical protein
MISSHDQKWQKSFWRATGVHVAANTWQIFFWLDVRRAFRFGLGPEEIDPYWLNIYEQRLKLLFSSTPVAQVAEILTRGWLWWMLRSTKKDFQA